MRDAHQMVVHDVGEIVGGHAVGLDEDLVVEGGIVHLDVAVHHVLKAGGALGGHLLADDVGHAGVELLFDLLGRQAAAVAVVVRGLAAGLLHKAHLVQALLVAEAVVGLALLHQLLGVGLEHAHALALDVRAHGAADVRALVPQKARLAQRVVDDVHRALDIALLVGVLDAQDEFAAAVLGHQVGVQRGAQVAHVHIAGRAGRETGADGVCHNSLLLLRSAI